MKYRVLSLLMAAAALMLLMTVPVEGQDKDKNVHVGKLLSVKGKTFIMESKGKKHDHILAKDGKVFDLDGKECKLADLEKNQLIQVTTKEGDEKVATKVEAIKKKKGA
jgi:inorganic pyrophosphatase/exopolyphosphatase